MDESFPAKRFNKMINRATSRSEPTLHIREQFEGFKVPDMSLVDHLFHGFTCQGNSMVIGRIWNRNDNCFPPIRRKSHQVSSFIRYLRQPKEKIQVFHLVL